MLKVEGTATLKVSFVTTIPITQEAFDKLSEDKQNALLDSRIDWANVMHNAELSDIDIWEIDEIQE